MTSEKATGDEVVAEKKCDTLSPACEDKCESKGNHAIDKASVYPPNHCNTFNETTDEQSVKNAECMQESGTLETIDKSQSSQKQIDSRGKICSPLIHMYV